MSGASPLMGMVMILVVMVGIAFLVGLFYLGDQGTGRRGDSDGRYRRRY
ncbi:hypothetical protein FHX41_3306 [Actinomadura hallensis]|uniref:Uncharacterized protein n=1 Tax=Actinomadura hallensis TaxID=337895 RepID=A0A543IG92_9ACTN|nr:hypothetical protein [Actinomadura hallensis]TQM69608.1 hypothetical protein FHX41_3306 [Actinomadura hallensis]